MKITVIYPSVGHSAYKIAAESFCEFAKKVSGEECSLISDNKFSSDIYSDLNVLIGSDSVNLVVADLFLNKKTDSFHIRYCTDDYTIRTLNKEGKNYLIFAGGRGRSTIYAVYRYFEKYMGAVIFGTATELKEALLLPVELI